MVKTTQTPVLFLRTLKRYALRGFVVLVLMSFLAPLYTYTRGHLRPSHVSAATGINHQISFQGKLVNPNGTNVTDGSYSIVFSMYTVAAAGTNIWTETQSVALSNGIFQVNLGSVTSLPGSVDFNTDNIYLGIKVGADAEMTPRVQFTAVPQAFNAEKLGGLDKTGFIQNSTALQATSNYYIQSNNAANVTAKFRAATSQTADIIQVRNSTDTTTVFAVSPAGIITAGTWNGTAIADAYVDNNLTIDWTGLQNYPAACGAGQAISAVGDTLTCINVASGSGSGNYIQNQFASAQSSSQFWISGNGRIDGVLTAGGGGALSGNFTIATTAGNTLGLGNATGALTVTGNSSTTFVINGATVTATEFNLLDGRDTALVDTTDAVATAITGTGALNAGSITSGFGTIDNADTITGTALNGTTGINTGAGAGTQRIDASGNITNIGSISASGAITTSGDILAGGQYTRSLTRTLPIVVNNTVDLGSFTLTNGGANLKILITVPSAGYSDAKQYILPIAYDNTANTWQIAEAISDNGGYAGNNYALDINVNAGTTSLRLRRTAGATAGTAYVTVIQQGVTSDTWTPSSSTASVAAPSAYYKNAILSQNNGAVNLQGNLNIGNSGNIATAGTTRLTAAGVLQNVTNADASTFFTGGTLGVARGGTGIASYAIGDMLYASGATTLSKLADVATGSCLISGGVGVTPAWGSCATGGGISGSGTSGQAAYFNGAGSITSSANFLFSGTNLTVSGSVSGSTLISTVATGTAPLTVASTTKVTNLNADLLDGLDSTAFATSSGSGNYIQNGTSIQTANFAVQSAAAGSIGAVIRGAVSQTADLLQLQNSAGAVVSKVQADGEITSYNSTGNYLRFTNGVGNETNIFRIYNSGINAGIGGNYHPIIKSDNGPVEIRSNGANALAIDTGSQSPAQTGIAIRAHASQSADLFQLQNSSGTVISAFDASGDLVVSSTGASSFAGTLAVTGAVTGSSTIQGTRLISTVATGTAPLTVASTTLVTNFNSDMLDGQSGAFYQDATNINAGTLAVARGGTGVASYTIGDMLYASGATTLSKLADVATGSCLISGGVGVAPAWGSCATGGGISGSGTSGQAAYFNGAGSITSSANFLFSGTNLTVSGTVIAGTSNGFRNAGYVGGYNPIWAFNNATTYGMGYYQVGSDILGIGQDAIGFHFGNTSAPTMYVKADGAVVSANTIQGTRLISTVATGTAPLTVSSTTLVSNFNSDLLDSQSGSFYQDATNLNAGTVASARISGSYTGITGTGALNAGSITSGFGTIDNADTITGTTINGTTGINTGAGAGTQRIDASGNLVNITDATLSGVLLQGGYSAADAATDNMVVNGDLERNNTTGWTGITNIVTGGYSGNYAARVVGSNTLEGNDYIPVDPTRDVIQLEAYIKKSVAGTTPGTMYFGYKAYNASKTVITTAPCGSYCYFAAAGVVVPVDGNWHKYSATTTGEGTVYPNFPVGTKYIRVMGLINYTSSADSETLVDHISARRINNGPLFVGNNFSTTNMVDQYLQTQLSTDASGNFNVTPAGGNFNLTSGALSTSGTTRLTATGLLQNVTYNGSIIAANYGGTGIGSIGSAGSIAYSNGTTYAFSAAGTTNQCLLSGGAGAPTWGACAPTAGTSLMTVQGNSGTPQGLLTGDTLSILGSGNLTAVASATDTITLSITNAPTFTGTVTVGNGTTGTLVLGDGTVTKSSGTGFNFNSLVNGQSGINTGAGNGTTRIDASGNLTNIGTVSASGTITTSSTVQGTRFISTVATGTAPLTVASTTKVTNLNADLLDGLDSTAFAASTGSGSYIQNQTASPQTAGFNINGNGTIGGTLSVTGNTATGSLVVGGLVVTKTLTYNFANGIANQKVDIYLPAAAYYVGSFDVSIIGNYSNQNAIGELTKKFNFGGDGSGSSWTNNSYYTNADPATSANFAISGITWDATNTRWRVQIVHRVSTGNPITIVIKGLAYDITAATNLNAMAIGTNYTTDATAFALPEVEFNNNVNFKGSGTGLTVTNNASFGTIGSGAITSTNTIQGTQLISTVATGTAPLTVASTTKVTNLNADLLDGLDSTAFALASGSGNYIQNGTSPQSANFNITGNGTIGGALAVAGNVNIGGGLSGRRLDVYNSANNGDGLAIGQDTDNSQTIQAYIDNQWTNRVAYASGCCNLLKLQPDVGSVQIGSASNPTSGLTVTGVTNSTSFTGAGTGLTGTASSLSIGGNAATVTDGMYLTPLQAVTGVKYFQSNKGATSTLGANNTYTLEAYATDGGAAAMSFHRNSSFAVNFGLDPDNVLRIGGWSAAANLWQLDMSGNQTLAGSLTAGTTIQGTRLISTVATGTAPLTVASTTMVGNLNVQYLGGYTENQIAQGLRSSNNISGGGTVTYTGSAIGWTSRFIVIANGNGADFTTAGYYDINMPADATVITGVGGAGNATVAGGAVPLGVWQALYYILPIGGNNATVNANFRVATYTGALQVPSNWVLLAVTNGDNGTARISTGLTLRAGQSTTNGTINNTVFNTSASAPQLISTIATGTAPLTVASTTKVTNLNADLLDGLDSTAFALASGSGNYIQNGTSPQSANFNITGNGTIGGTLAVTGAATFTSTVTASQFNGSGAGLTGTAASLNIGGNAATATNLSTTRLNWSTNGTITGVVGQLAWKNYGNGHTIFDASQGTAPDGSARNNTNPEVAWAATYPTLMGWNGANTYGVRVDSARLADNAGLLDGLDSTAFAPASGSGNYINNTTSPQSANFNITGNGTIGGTLAVTGNATFDTNTLFVDSTNNRVGIGTVAPNTALDVGSAGSLVFSGGNNYTYNNLATYSAGGATTGAMKVTLPKAWTSGFMSMTIKGYDYSGSGAWEVVVGGYNYGGTGWYNTSAEIRGSAPFSQVRLAYDGSKVIVLLGTTSTNWSYSSATVESFMVSADVTGWGTGWSITLIGSESGFSFYNSPAVRQTAYTNNAFIQGGNSFGTTATLGTNDSQSLVLETANTARLTIDSAGAATFSGTLSATTSVNTATYQVGSVSRLTSNGTYTQINDGAGTAAIYLGNGDPANYYDNGSHIFRNKAGSNYATITATGLNLTGTVVASGTIQGTQLISTVATGTAPLTVTSTTQVNNLNVQYVGGLQGSQFVRNDADGTTTGRLVYSGTSNGQAYSQAPIEIIEAWSGGAGLAPRIGFHYSGAVASQIGFVQGDSSGDISILNNPGTGYESLRVGDLLIGATAIIDSSRNIVNAGTGGFSGNITTAAALISTVATGTAPLTVTSTTQVNNLNVQYLQGATPSMVAGNSTIVQRNATGYVLANYFNTTADVTAGSASHFAIQTGSDNYIRWQTPADARTSLGVSAGGAGDIWVEKAGDTMTGALSLGANTLTSGLINGQTISSAANFTGTLAVATSVTTPNYYVTAGNGNGIGYWGSAPSTYGTYMAYAAGGLYGSVSDYYIANNMSSGAGRGFVWLYQGTPTMALNASSGNLAIAGSFVGASTIQGTSIISTVATGTAPLTVTSTTKVTNLNVDWLDGLDSTAFAAASGNGNYINNTTSPQSANFNITGNGTIGGTLAVGSTLTANTLSVTGNITSGVWQGTAIGAAYGGTGQTSYAVGDLLYASGATALSKLTAGTASYCLKTNGAGVAPSWGGCINNVGGANQIAYFTSSGVLAGSTNLTYNGTTLSVAGEVVLSSTALLRTTAGTDFTIQAGSAGSAGIILNSNQLRLQNNGTVSTPGYSFVGFGGAGMYHTGTDLGFTLGGTQRLSLGSQTSIWISATQRSQRLCHNGGDAPAASMVTIGDCLNGGSDFAEYYGSPGDVPVASIVEYDASRPIERFIDPTDPSRMANRAYVKTATDRSKALGVHSTNPFVDVLGKEYYSAADNIIPIGLAGRVPIRVNASNGAIAVGDPIMLSTTPGVGAKATTAGMIVGYAMEGYNGSGEGSIVVLVSTGYWAPESIDLLQAQSATIGDLTVTGSADLATLNVSGATTLASLTVTGDAEVQGNLTVSGNITTQNITVNGHIITAGDAPTLTLGLGAGTEDVPNNIAAPVVTIEGNDTSGTITITTGANTTADELTTLVFSNPFTGKPRIILSPANREATKISAYYDAAGATQAGFRILTDISPEPTKTYIFTYYTVE